VRIPKAAAMSRSPANRSVYCWKLKYGVSRFVDTIVEHVPKARLSRVADNQGKTAAEPMA
jgi:hypothetical protein